jgi:O-Antigen ligase
MPMRIVTSPGTVDTPASSTAPQASRFPPEALLYGASLAASVVVAAAVTTRARYVLGLFALALLIAVLRKWPVTIWAFGLAVCVFLGESTRVIVQAGSLSIYLSDLVPVLIIIGAASAGRLGSVRSSWVRFPMQSAIAFFIIVLLEVFRTFSAYGLTFGLQARVLWPLIIMVTLPGMKSFSAIKSRHVASVISLAAIALALRTLYLLVTGTESVYGHGAQAGTTSLAVLGVQRVFQTWEPFIGAGMGLILLAYVLGAKHVTRLHYVGLAVSPIPVLFGFFRTSWVIFGLLSILLLIFMKESQRRGAILAGVMAMCILFAAGALLTQKVPTYASQFQKRFAEIHVHLDTYRVQEYSAVWAEIKKEVVFGQGFGTNYVGGFTDVRSFAHNAYEWLWWRVGLIGLLPFIFLLVSSVVGGLTRNRYLGDRDDRALATGLVAAIMFTALAANLHENFESNQSNLFIGLIFAELFALHAYARKGHTTNSHS